jgi:hypothetical protein
VYTPAPSVRPARSAEIEAVLARLDASLNAVVSAAFAASAVASAAWMVPALTTPGGNPVTAVPGLTPRLPRTVDGPVLVTVVPASTAYPAADPRPTGGVAAEATPGPELSMQPMSAMTATDDARRMEVVM